MNPQGIHGLKQGQAGGTQDAMRVPMPEHSAGPELMLGQCAKL